MLEIKFLTTPNAKIISAVRAKKNLFFEERFILYSAAAIAYAIYQLKTGFKQIQEIILINIVQIWKIHKWGGRVKRFKPHRDGLVIAIYNFIRFKKLFKTNSVKFD